MPRSIFAPLARPLRTALIALLLVVATAPVAQAGGAWVPDRGDGDIQLGFSRKTADTSWDSSGETFANSGRFENHDFRYTYLSGEVGVFEAGYGVWVWGRSARQYEEPFVSIGTSF